MMTPRIAMIEDDDGLRGQTLEFLRRHGWEAWGAGSAAEFWQRLSTTPADLVLVDLSLPSEDAISVLRKLRDRSERGILALTERGSVRERLLGFEHGADHCLDKPLDLEEVASTVRALWRRVRHTLQHQGGAQTGVSPLTGWAIDAARNLLMAPDGRSAILSDQEFSLVAALFADPGTVIPKQTLLRTLYPGDGGSGDPHRIEVVLSRARRRAAAAGLQLPVRSVFGKGLVFTTAQPPEDRA
ncbi:MAG: hypothetical protein RIS35_735 [Pseudomonadota bacterium]